MISKSEGNSCQIDKNWLEDGSQNLAIAGKSSLYSVFLLMFCSKFFFSMT